MARYMSILLVVAAISGASAAGLRQLWQQVSSSEAALGPVCTALAASLKMTPSQMASFVPMLPTPPGADFCPWLNNQASPCDTIALLESGFVGPDINAINQCDNSTGTGNQILAVGNLTALKDLRPLPEVLPNPQELFEAEGASYYWLYTQLQSAWNYSICTPASCAECTDTSLLLPEGWSVRATADLAQPNGVELPLLFVLENPTTNQLVFLVRGTRTPFEWTLDFQLNQTDSPEALEVFNAPIEYGFYNMFKTIWPTIQESLDAKVVNATNPAQVWVTGHSLGAAVGTLSAFAMQTYLNEHMGEDAVLVNSVQFADPNVGGEAFVEQFNKVVNNRALMFENDIVWQVPCSPSMPACPANPGGMLGQVGITAVPTNQGGVTAWDYESVGGQLHIKANQIPVDTASWELITSIPLCWAKQYLVASHECSYLCYLSQFAGAPTDNTRCWLRNIPEGTPQGEVCIGFPVEGLFASLPN